MKSTLLSALVLGILVGASSVCPAQDDTSKAAKPVVVVSLAGFDQTIKAVDTVGKLGASPIPLSALVEGIVKQQLGEQGLAGLDTKRPWGFVLQTDGQNLTKIGFLPVTDLKKLLAALESKIGRAKDDGKGVFELNAKDEPFYATQKDNWVFVSDNAESLANAPKDPQALLGGLNESYDVATRVTIKNIPAMYRQMILAPIQMGMAMGAERRPGEGEEEFALRSKMTKQAVQQIVTMVEELDTLQLGLKVDEKASVAYLDYQITAVPGTKTARQMSEAKAMKSKFAGFLAPEAALSVNLASKAAETDLAQVKTTLAAARANAMKELDKQELADADRKLAKQMVGDLMDILDKTLEGGVLDGGVAVMLDANLLTLAGGLHVADTAKLDALLRQLVAQIPKEAAEISSALKLDAETHEGIKLHTFSWPTSKVPNAGKLPQLVGESVDIVLGIGPQGVYLAAGRNAAKTLKQLIDKSKAAGEQIVPPARVSIAVTPIAKLVAATGDGKAKAVAGMIVKLLEQSAGKDHVTITSTPISNGAKVRIELEQGILKVLASAPMLAMGAGGPPSGGPVVPSSK